MRSAPRTGPAGIGWPESSLLAYLATLEALQGRFDTAREHVAAGRSTAEELGLMWDAGMQANLSSFIETLAGDPAAAERDMRAALEVFEANGDRWYLSTAVVDLAPGRSASRVAMTRPLTSQ